MLRKRIPVTSAVEVVWSHRLLTVCAVAILATIKTSFASPLGRDRMLRSSQGEPTALPTSTISESLKTDPDDDYSYYFGTHQRKGRRSSGSVDENNENSVSEHEESLDDVYDAIRAEKRDKILRMQLGSLKIQVESLKGSLKEHYEQEMLDGLQTQQLLEAARGEASKNAAVSIQ